VNAEGATAPIRFTVGSLPQIEEKEPNDERDQPQTVAQLPAWIMGQLDKPGDVDGYAVSLKKGVSLLIRLDAYVLSSSVDMHVQVLDSQGAVLLTASDGRNLDPEAVFISPADGSYVVRVAGFAMPPGTDVGFTGGAGKVYQLTLTTGPAVTGVFPAAVPFEGKQSVQFRGLGLKAEVTKGEVAAVPLSGLDEIGTVLPPHASAPIDVVRTRYPIQTPQPASVEAPPVLQPPVVIGGALLAAGSVAAYRVEMKKGEKLKARFWSKSLGLSVEGSLRVLGPAGNQVAGTDVGADAFSEPVLSWTASMDGPYTVSVSDLFRRGGTGFEFVLEVSPPSPGYAVTLADGKPLRVEVGKTATFKAKVVLNDGWKDPLVARLRGLPDGVYAAEIPVPEKGGDVEFTLQAASNASPRSAPVSVEVWTRSDPPVFSSAAFPVRADLRRGHSQSDFAKDLWVSVVVPGTPPPPAPAKK
jgi:hypothetical protein